MFWDVLYPELFLHDLLPHDGISFLKCSNPFFGRTPQRNMLPPPCFGVRMKLFGLKASTLIQSTDHYGKHFLMVDVHTFVLFYVEFNWTNWSKVCVCVSCLNDAMSVWSQYFYIHIQLLDACACFFFFFLSLGWVSSHGIKGEKAMALELKLLTETLINT